MRHSKGLVFMVLGIMLLTVTVEAAQQQAPQQQSGSKVGRFFRGLFRFPARTTEKSVGVATHAATKTTKTATGTIENVGKAMTGSKKAAVGMVTEPVKGAATTTYETTKGAVMAPVEGAHEAIHDEPMAEEK